MRKKLKKSDFMALWSGDAWRENKHFLEWYLGKNYKALQVGDEVAFEEFDYLILYEVVFIDNEKIELILVDLEK